MILKYTLLWLPMVLIAIINGIIRDLTYKKYLGDLTAHQVSTLTGMIFFGVYIWIISSKWKLESAGQALAVGFIWLVLTVAFEFLFFHYVAGHPWSLLLDNYNILEGRVWVLILLFITIAPYIAYKIHCRKRE
jgi:hypothetical protein